MPWFQSKPKRVHAEQFTDKKAPPRGVQSFTVASGYTTFFVVTAQERRVSVVIGEWIVDEGDGKHFYPIADEIFTGLKAEKDGRGEFWVIGDDVLERIGKIQAPIKDFGPPLGGMRVVALSDYWLKRNPA